jgi:hypothetical protein
MAERESTDDRIGRTVAKPVSPRAAAGIEAVAHTLRNIAVLIMLAIGTMAICLLLSFSGHILQ